MKVQVNNGYNNGDTGTMIAIMMTIMAAKLVIAQTVTNTTITYMDNVIFLYVSRMYVSRQVYTAFRKRIFISRGRKRRGETDRTL